MCGSEEKCFFVGTTDDNHEPIDPYVQVLPRYHLCHESKNPESSFRHVYGFPVAMKNSKENAVAHLWYYSSHGDLMQLSQKRKNQVQRALILVHGAARNADDYFCVATKAAQLWQQQQQHTLSSSAKVTSDNILVLAPRFVTPTDEPFDKTAATIPNLLQWKDDGSGPWRYGANAIFPAVAAANNVSSYDAMDQLVSFLHNEFPQLQHLTIAGHSSGGQFVQRYSLLTSSSVIPPLRSTSLSAEKLSSSSTNHHLTTKTRVKTNAWSPLTTANQNGNKQFQVRFVVANPSSYAYLTPLRFVEEMGVWIMPKQNDNTTSCGSQYNEYPWGLQPPTPSSSMKNDPSSVIVVPYKDRALEALQNNVTALIERFLQQRRVVYLIGSVDRCNLSSTKFENSSGGVVVANISSNADKIIVGQQDLSTDAVAEPWRTGGWWCDSHGLETSCMDLWQGSNRWFRHVHYMNSLKLLQQQPKGVQLAQQPAHTSDVVEGVGHDHSLIYLSTVGLKALWGTDDGT
jgi:hypothetical protein